MATIDDINAQKDAAVAILDIKIVDAITVKNNGGAGMDQIVHDLMAQRQMVFLSAFNQAASSDEMTAALSVLKAATAQMNTVASEMKTATTFIASIANFLTGAKKVVSALNSGSPAELGS
jgi:hypothetical protein